MRNIVIAPLLFFLATPAAAESRTAIVGDYVEVRSNHVYTCGCLASGETETDGREALLAWKISDGLFRGVPVGGVSAAAVVFGPSNLGVEGTTRKSVVYVDSSATADQRQAALALLRERYADILGDLYETRNAPVELRMAEDRVDLRIGDFSTVRMRQARLPEDAHLGSYLWYESFIPMSESTLGTAELFEFRGEGFDLSWRVSEPRITGFFGSFTLASH